MITMLSSAYLTRPGRGRISFAEWQEGRKESRLLFVVGLTVVRDATVPSTVESGKKLGRALMLC